MASAVTLDVQDGPPQKVRVVGETYALVLNCASAVIEEFSAGDEHLIGEVPLSPIIDASNPRGPGALTIAQQGDVFAEIHLTELTWGELAADIELVLYCYREHVVATVNVVPRGIAPDMLVGWYGGVKYSMPLPMQSEVELQSTVSFKGQNPKAVAVVLEPWMQFGLFGEKLKSRFNFRNSVGQLSGGYGYKSTYTCPRRASIMLLARRSNEELKEAVRGVGALPFAKVQTRGGAFGRYDASRGYFKIERHGDGDLAVDVTFAQPPAPPPVVHTLRDRAALAASRLDGKWWTVLIALLAVVVFGARARPEPGTFAARVRPKTLAAIAALTLVTAAAWLFRIPPAPPPSVLPMPRDPVPAVFQVVNATGDEHVFGADGQALLAPMQSRVRQDGTKELYFECALAPQGTTSIVLRDIAGVRVTDGAAVH
ncbi:MAG: hypothetical protein FJY92_12920 [Candidatus Hydrogenedentes bacterium]|nr:hypothetical protein [Candidatus Hydrogenedentota bacterium]